MQSDGREVGPVGELGMGEPGPAGGIGGIGTAGRIGGIGTAGGIGGIGTAGGIGTFGTVGERGRVRGAVGCRAQQVPERLARPVPGGDEAGGVLVGPGDGVVADRAGHHRPPGRGVTACW